MLFAWGSPTEQEGMDTWTHVQTQGQVFDRF